MTTGGFWGLACCICFERLTPDKCAVDEEGKWDVCKGECAEAAGIVEIESVTTQHLSNDIK